MDGVTVILLSLSFLFFVGSCLGWCIEVLFRRFFSAKKWINPGFLTGPYLPLYGFGLVGLYLICMIPIQTGIRWLDSVLIILVMGAVMTLIEYVAGIIFIKGMKIKLWDYSNRPGNIQGIICPLFSLIWTAVGAIYYFVIDPFVIDWVEWFVSNIAFSFVVGVFFGVFFVDLAHSVNLSVRIRRFAADHGIVVAYERLKESIKDGFEKMKEERERLGKKVKKPSFIFAFRSDKTLEESLGEYTEGKSKNN
ncbi:MAG: hypothetical protein ACI4L9_00390 [Candidatus Coproplasma sp.]